MTYLDLVEQLLKSPLGEEQQILNDNRNLIDADLTQHMLQVADDLLKQGDFSNADRLMTLAGQLLGAYNNASATTASETNYDFLIHILQAISDSNADPEVVYLLIQASLDQLDDHFADKLRRWAAAKLLEIEADQAPFIAQLTLDFGNLMYQFPLGSKASNLEIAIASYAVAASIFTREAFPKDWAVAQMNLGAIYVDRIRGEKTDNLEQAIDCCRAALQVFTNEAFPQNWAQYWALTQMNLGNAYSNRIWGEQADNLEQTIDCYQSALQVFTSEAFPENWAVVQHNLGAAYANRVRGEATENVEQAIAYYQASLQVLTCESFPHMWAKTQMNLGTNYSVRIQGGKADNLERAIACYQASLQVLTHKSFPYDWAIIQMNLGVDYSDRIQGEKADNLEDAIVCYQAALQIFTRESFPYDWAIIQMNLGRAYSDRIRGEKRVNLEEAITYCQAALQVLTRESFPHDWAKTQLNLGLAHFRRIKGKRASNLEEVITYCQAALQVLTRELFPYDWAMTQANLGVTYTERIWGDQAYNIDKAIVHFQSSLEVWTCKAFPHMWAMTQMNLGVTYIHKSLRKRTANWQQSIDCYQLALQGCNHEAFPQDWAMIQTCLGNAYFLSDQNNETENLDRAIDCYQNILKVLTLESFPYEWAMTQANLGLAFSNKIKRKQTDNLEKAIDCYCAALHIYTYDAFPYEWAGVQYWLGLIYSDDIEGKQADNLKKAIDYYHAALQVYTCNDLSQKYVNTLFALGRAYQDTNQLLLAHQTFTAGIDTVELLRGEIISGDETKQKLAEEHNEIYREMVKVCLKLGEFTQAFEYVERSKTRNLVELILQRDLHSSVPPDVASQLEQLRDEIASGQSQLQHSQADDPVALAQRLRELRQQRNDLQDHYLPIGFGFKFDRFQQQCQKILDDRTAIIEWYIMGDRFLAFILTSEAEQISVWQSTTNDGAALFDWANAYVNDYFYSKDKWRDQLTTRLEQMAMILHLDELIQQLPESCNRLILIPHQFLHILPLHALPLNHQPENANNPKLLMDRFSRGVSYAPSCQLLLQAQQRQRPNFTHLFAIQNPTGDLTYADLEVQAITPYFPSTDVHKHAEATLAAIHHTSLNTAHCVHFGCHGSFNLTNPRHSALSLANAPLSAAPAQPNSEHHPNLQERGGHNPTQNLTLDAIFSLNLSQCRLVTLSACETGLINFNNLSDEYIGLPSGFLVAGSPAVVSSLWRVDDLSTSFLMIKFYEILTSNPQQGAIAIALNQAQQWLRTLTVEGSKQFLNNHKSQLQGGQFPIFMEYLKQIEHCQHPFANPYYWAAFIATGL